MARLSTRQVSQQLLLLGGLLPWGLASSAGDPIAAAPSDHGPRIMLYIAVPLGARDATRIYGLRLEQTMPMPVPQTGVPIGPLRRNELVDLQIRPHSDVRVEFARKLTWDLGRQEFGGSSAAPNIVLRLPMHPPMLAEVLRPQPYATPVLRIGWPTMMAATPPPGLAAAP